MDENIEMSSMYGFNTPEISRPTTPKLNVPNEEEHEQMFGRQMYGYNSSDISRPSTPKVQHRQMFGFGDDDINNSGKNVKNDKNDKNNDDKEKELMIHEIKNLHEILQKTTLHNLNLESRYNKLKEEKYREENLKEEKNEHNTNNVHHSDKNEPNLNSFSEDQKPSNIYSEFMDEDISVIASSNDTSGNSNSIGVSHNKQNHEHITYKKYSYQEVEDEIEKNYFDKNEKYSSALDILASYLRGQKLIYMESKAYCEHNLNILMTYR